MKKIVFILSMLFFYFSNSLYAQQIVFTVLGIKGSVKVGDDKLKVGYKLKTGQSVQIGEDSYLSLSSSNSKLMEITQQGTYTVKQLLEKLPAAQSMNKAYADFVVSELTKVEAEGISAKNRFQHMNKSGSVKRGGVVTSYLDFFKTGDEGHKLYGTTLNLMWYVFEKPNSQKLPIASYAVEVVGIDDTPYAKQNTKESEALIDLSKMSRAETQSVIAKIIPLDSKGISLDKTEIDGVTINLLSDAERKSIKEQIKQFAGKSATNKLMEARFFEEKHFYIDAMVSYKEAISLSGGSEEYENMYYQYLLRYIKM